MHDLARELDELGGADLTKALEELPVCSFVLDRDAMVRWQNKQAREMFGDRVGKKWAAVMTERSVRDVDELWRRILCSGEPAELTIEAVLPDGRVERRDVSAAPLREGGSVIGVFGVGLAAGEPLPKAIPANELGLTERQVEVLQLLAEGKSTEQIAAALHLSKTTVRNHIARILGALDVPTRVQAIVAASRAGLITMR